MKYYRSRLQAVILINSDYPLGTRRSVERWLSSAAWDRTWGVTQTRSLGIASRQT
jgi:hypothetical protein